MKAELMEELYAGVTDPERMQSFVERLGRAVGCHSGSVTLRTCKVGVTWRWLRPARWPTRVR